MSKKLREDVGTTSGAISAVGAAVPSGAPLTREVPMSKSTMGTKLKKKRTKKKNVLRATHTDSNAKSRIRTDRFPVADNMMEGDFRGYRKIVENQFYDDPTPTIGMRILKVETDDGDAQEGGYEGEEQEEIADEHEDMRTEIEELKAAVKRLEDKIGVEEAPPEDDTIEDETEEQSEEETTEEEAS